MADYKRFQFNPGDIISHYKMISRDYCTGSGNWFCTFECLDCGDTIQARLKNIQSGASPCSCKKTNKANLIGQTKGVLTIIDKAPKRPNDRNAYWKCRCECGEVFEISTTNFNRHTHEHCQHLSGGRPPTNLIGKIFDKLTVVEYLGDRRWKCKCTCGQETTKRTDQLTTREFCACSTCNSINGSHGERRLTELLKELNIDFESQKSFETCRFPNTNMKARFDFYLPKYNLLIEYNGIQHYEANNRGGWNTDENVKKTQERDNYKIQWCKDNNISLVIISYTELKNLNTDYIKNILNNYK